MAKVLIADSVAFERISLKDIFNKLGHEVVAEASNTNDLVKMYGTANPDYVIMDIALSDSEGTNSLKTLLKKYPEAKVCVCTAMAQQVTVIESINIGAKDFIVKPYQPNRIKQSIEKVLAE